MRLLSEEITSRQNPYVSYLCKLADKKCRDKEKRFRIDGIKLLSEAVACGAEIDSVAVTKSACERYRHVLESLNYGIAVRVISDGVFSKISEEKAPEGVICVIKYIDKFHKMITINNEDEDLSSEISKSEKIFVLESVRDPGNLGTVVRTAAAFGVDLLVISRDCADIYNPRTLRAAMGAIFHQRILRVNDVVPAIFAMRRAGRRVYAAALAADAKLLGRFELEKNDCIVVGNEGHGLSEETISACTEKMLIPMVPGTESLNAAVASSICLWEQFGRKL